MGSVTDFTERNGKLLGLRIFLRSLIDFFLKGQVIRVFSSWAFCFIGVLLFPLRWWRRKTFQPSKLRRILINMGRLDKGIGDTLLATPLIQALHQVAPEAEIWMLLPRSKASDIVKCFPVPVQIIEITRDQYYQSQRGWFSFVRRVLRPRRFQLIIHEYLEAWWSVAYISVFTGSPHIMAYSRLAAEKWPNTLSTMTLHYNSVGLLPFVYNEELAAFLGYDGPWQVRLDPTLKAEEVAADIWPGSDILSGGPILGIHPGCLKSQAIRRWPVANFAEVGSRFCREYGGKVLIFGGPDEEEEAGEIETRFGGNRARAVVGQSLEKVVALIQSCSVFVSNDSGLMHISLAVGLPTVGIFGPTDSTRYGRLYPQGIFLRGNVSCDPCFDTPKYKPWYCNEWPPPCIKAVSVDEVYAATRTLLARNRLMEKAG